MLPRGSVRVPVSGTARRCGPRHVAARNVRFPARIRDGLNRHLGPSSNLRCAGSDVEVHATQTPVPERTRRRRGLTLHRLRVVVVAELNEMTVGVEEVDRLAGSPCTIGVGGSSTIRGIVERVSEGRCGGAHSCEGCVELTSTHREREMRVAFGAPWPSCSVKPGPTRTTENGGC